jgi:hypothetical protein
MNNGMNPYDDFWGRQRCNEQRYSQLPLQAAGLVGADHRQSAGCAGRGGAVRRAFQPGLPPRRPPEWLIKIVVGDQPAGPVPADLPAQLIYSGVDDWITVSAGKWGHGSARLATREALVLLTPELAAETRLVSRYFIDHYLLNFILTTWAMLHASCVLSPDGRQLVVIIAPHNSGKSTTALHLLRAGFGFVADGMALLRHDDAGFEVGGYPVGEVKLRDDVLAMFPAYSGQTVTVREQQKTVVNLRRSHPDNLVERVVRPERLALCFLERGNSPETIIRPLPAAQAAATAGREYGLLGPAGAAGPQSADHCGAAAKRGHLPGAAGQRPGRYCHGVSGP